MIISTRVAAGGPGGDLDEQRGVQDGPESGGDVLEPGGMHVRGEDDGMVVVEEDADDGFQFFDEVDEFLELVDEQDGGGGALHGRGIVDEAADLIGEIVGGDVGQAGAAGGGQDTVDDGIEEMGFAGPFVADEYDRGFFDGTQIGHVLTDGERLLIALVNEQCAETKPLHHPAPRNTRHSPWVGF